MSRQDEQLAEWSYEEACRLVNDLEDLTLIHSEQWYGVCTACSNKPVWTYRVNQDQTCKRCRREVEQPSLEELRKMLETQVELLLDEYPGMPCGYREYQESKEN